MNIKNWPMVIAVVAVMVSVAAICLPGAAGEQGIPGQQGIQGPVGSQGLPGVLGLQGIQGIQGEIGLAGEPGLQGEKGDTGHSYATIASVYAPANTVARGAVFILYGSGFDSNPSIQLVDSNGIWFDLGEYPLYSFGIFKADLTIPAGSSVGVGCLVVFQGGNPVESFPLVIG